MKCQLYNIFHIMTEVIIVKGIVTSVSLACEGVGSEVTLSFDATKWLSLSSYSSSENMLQANKRILQLCNNNPKHQNKLYLTNFRPAI